MSERKRIYLCLAHMNEDGERRDRYLFQIEYEQLDNKEVKECLGKLENHQELVYIT